MQKYILINLLITAIYTLKKDRVRQNKLYFTFKSAVNNK